MIPELKTACSICESGAVIERYKHIVFTEGTLRAFNGVVSVQAPSTLDATETFAVNEDRLAQALSACEEDAAVSLNKDFMVLKKGKLTVRIRRLDAAGVFHDPIIEPAKKSKVKAGGLMEALVHVAPFMSSDASRPWTTSILLRDGYAWATNNLSMVRYPLDLPLDCVIPAAAVPVLLSLGDDLDFISREVNHTGPYPGAARIICGIGALRISFPEASAQWPANVDEFFKKAPKKLPVLAKELYDAAKIVEKFADRFVSLKPERVEAKFQSIESEFEIEVPNGKGIYPAKLLLLVLNHATHADFSTYPEPIFFAGAKLRGVAVGAREGAQ